MTWRRLSLWIRHFWADPSSALFAAIAQSVAPPSTDDVLDGMSMHQQMQMLRWTSTDELLLGVSNEVRNVMALVLQIKSAEAKKPAPVIPSLKRPWEHTDGADAESVRAQIDEYNSPESLAARAAVTGAPIPDPGKG